MLALSEFNRELWLLSPMEFVRLEPSIERMALKYFCRIEPCISLNCFSSERRNDDAMVFRKRIIDGYGKEAFVFLVVQLAEQGEGQKPKCVLHYFGSTSKHWFDAGLRVSYVNCIRDTTPASEVFAKIRELTVQSFSQMHETDKSKRAFFRLLNSFVKR